MTRVLDAVDTLPDALWALAIILPVLALIPVVMVLIAGFWSVVKVVLA